jgi:hypothetical protein
MDKTAESASVDASRDLLRHTLATLAYRAAKAVRGAPAGFSEFRPGETSRSAGQILAHLAELMDWALTMAQGKEQWRAAPPLAWVESVDRFFASLEAFDDFLASDSPLAVPTTKLFQGPVADALTHTGQIAMLRRLAGAPVRGESYFRADIVAGRVGLEQSPPRREFD